MHKAQKKRGRKAGSRKPEKKVEVARSEDGSERLERRAERIE